MKAEIINRVREIYKSNGNIMEYLRNLEKRTYNIPEDIMISYDFQAGSYNAAYYSNVEKYEQYYGEISEYLNKYIQNINAPSAYRILEAGIGEGTTFRAVMSKLNIKPTMKYGFDISWSRVHECNRFTQQIDNKFIFVGDLNEIPLKTNSIDIVYTAHALEPNGGNEKKLLQELYRVSSKYLILFEPAYEFANKEQKKRMEFHGYVKNLSYVAKELGYQVIEHSLLEHPLNEMNPTAVIVIQKGEKTIEGEPLCDPVSKGDLFKGESSYFSPDSLLAYPIVEHIPCLNSENGLLATKYLPTNVE